MFPSLDTAVQSVLEQYHQRMEAERPRMRSASEAGQRAVRSKPKMSSVLVPVGSGLEISRYDA